MTTITTEQFIVTNTGSTANDGTGDSLRASFIKINTNFTNISDIGFDAGNVNVMGAMTINNTLAPTLATDPGVTGQIVWDSGYIYICVDTDTWKRAAIATWP